MIRALLRLETSSTVRTRVSVTMEPEVDAAKADVRLERDLKMIGAFAETRGRASRSPIDTPHRHHLPERPGRLTGRP